MSQQYKNIFESRRDGFGMNLYRNTKSKKIGGVCAGLADHFEIDHNIMRLIFIASAVFTGMLSVWAYIAGWIILTPNRSQKKHVDMEYDENERCYRKRKVFRYRRAAGERVRAASDRLSEINKRVEKMERYVTSRRYDLDKKFADLQNQ